jgi:hypothetical protein
MNERIQELVGQAKFVAEETTNKQISKNAELDAFAEKFAELIVQECMWKIMVRKEEAIDNNWNVDEAMSATLSDISEHFGVEP